jgi:hypothetical protein
MRRARSRAKTGPSAACPIRSLYQSAPNGISTAASARTPSCVWRSSSARTAQQPEARRHETLDVRLEGARGSIVNASRLLGSDGPGLRLTQPASLRDAARAVRRGARRHQHRPDDHGRAAHHQAQRGDPHRHQQLEPIRGRLVQAALQHLGDPGCRGVRRRNRTAGAGRPEDSSRIAGCDSASSPLTRRSGRPHPRTGAAAV